MLYKVADDTLIRAQSSPTNTNFQALSNRERKVENIVSSQFIAPKWIGALDWMHMGMYFHQLPNFIYSLDLYR